MPEQRIVEERMARRLDSLLVKMFTTAGTAFLTASL